jgi:hypothetical protein
MSVEENNDEEECEEEMDLEKTINSMSSSRAGRSTRPTTAMSM